MVILNNSGAQARFARPCVTGSRVRKYGASGIVLFCCVLATGIGRPVAMLTCCSEGALL